MYIISASTLLILCLLGALPAHADFLGDPIPKIHGGSGNVSGAVAISGDTMTGGLQSPTQTVTGTLAAATVNVTGLTGSKIVFTNASKNLVSSTSNVTDSELSNLAGTTVSMPTLLNGVTAALQPQINAIIGAMLGSGGADAFSFTNQSGVNLNTPTTSNSVALSGFYGALYASCTGCTAIVRNGLSGGQSAAFLPGDTIALKVVSSPSPLTAVTASVQVGTTLSGSWTVTTASAVATTPNAFSFLDQTGVIPGTTIMSNTVQLKGFTGSVTAQCLAGSGCVNVAINGVWGVTTGIINGNLITMEQTASASTSTQTSATVTVGSTTSSAWNVTTNSASDPCANSPAPGTVCLDGSVYAGLSPDGNVPMYTTPCDVGMSWGGASCTGSRTSQAWAAANSATGANSGTAGKANTATLMGIGASFPAASSCTALTSFGHSDWYLPALNELNLLYVNNAAIGGFGGLIYFTSTEYVSNVAYEQNFSSGATVVSNGKTTVEYTRCVRR